MVLLKNDESLLPLQPPTSSAPLKLALIGPHLQTVSDLLSSHGYAGENKLVNDNTIEAAFKRRVAAATGGGKFEIVGTAAGCDIVHGCLNANLSAVAAAVASADVVIAFVGLHPASGAAPPAEQTNCTESEGWDRHDITLCGEQEAILATAAAGGLLLPADGAAGSGGSGGARKRKLVTVMINGGTISASWIKQHADAVLEGWCKWSPFLHPSPMSMCVIVCVCEGGVACLSFALYRCGAPLTRTPHRHCRRAHPPQILDRPVAKPWQQLCLVIATLVAACQ